MPTHRTRPPAEVTIADCASCVIVRNPSPKCPHGLFYRETSVETYPAEIRAQSCTAPECEATEYAIHAGESITFRAARSIGEREALSEALIASAQEAEDEVKRAKAEGRETDVSPIDVALEAQLRMVGERIVAWNWTDVDGEPIPLPSADHAGFRRALELAEVLWLWSAIMRGGDPKIAARAEGNGDAASPST